MRNDASGKCGPVSSSLGGSADELTFIPHSFSEGGISAGSVVAAPDAEDGAFTSLPDLKGSQSQQGKHAKSLQLKCVTNFYHSYVIQVSQWFLTQAKVLLVG